MTSQFSGDNFVDLSYSSYPTEITSIPSRLFQSIKFDSRNSPISPFSTHFDIQNLTPYNDTTQDQQQSSANSITETTPSNSSLNHNENYFLDSTNRIKHALMELESALMSPDDDDDNATNSINRGRSSTPGVWNQETIPESHSPQDSTFPREAFVMQGVPPDNLKQLLIMCAKALSENNLGEFHKLIELARASVSITGEPIQRLGAYMLEGLIARKELSGTNIYRSLKCNEPTSKDLLSYMHILYDICPYLKFGYMAANGSVKYRRENFIIEFFRVIHPL